MAGGLQEAEQFQARADHLRGPDFLRNLASGDVGDILKGFRRLSSLLKVTREARTPRFAQIADDSRDHPRSIPLKSLISATGTG